MQMRWIRTLRLIPLTCVALLFSSCSYATDFVVVNESNQAIEVLYKLKTEFGRLSSLDAPVTTEASDLDSKGGKNWIKLASTQYHFDDLTRTVTVRLEAGRALRVTTMSNYSGHDNPHKAASYPIDYISLSGPSGSITFAGDQARVSFRYVSGNLYTLTYK
jgi:hypothetical protein